MHSTYSVDGRCDIKDLVRIAKKKGIDGFALTDHNTIEGHKVLSRFRRNDVLIIPGVEITSSKGHIVALGIRDLIPRGLEPAEVVERIKEQGGVAIAAHPFVLGRNPSLVFSAKFDAVEGLNGRAFFPANQLAQKVAHNLKLPMVAGSDAHRCDEIGCVFTKLNAHFSIDSVLEEIRKGRTTIGGKPLSFPKVLWRSLIKVFGK